jgi:hypothetical protein
MRFGDGSSGVKTKIGFGFSHFGFSQFPTPNTEQLKPDLGLRF